MADSRPASGILPPLDGDVTQRPESVASLASSADDVAIELNRHQPLPPIHPVADEENPTIDLNVDTIDTNVDTIDPNVVNSPLMENSMAASSEEHTIVENGMRRPRITSNFRRETDDGHSSGGSAGSMRRAGKAKASKAKTALDTRTIECQTEWSWLDDMKTVGKATRKPSKSSLSSHGKSSHKGHPESSGDDGESDLKDDDHLNEDSGGLERGSTAGRSAKSTLSSKDTISRTAGRYSAPDPLPSREDEYGIPILALSSDSDTSDDESVYQATGEEEPNTLPSIGPPQILQYQRESSKMYDMGDGTEAPVMSQEELDAIAKQLEAAAGGIFEGECEFCNNSIKPFPSIEDQKKKDPQHLYCCEEYQGFVNFMVKHPLHEENMKPQKIDVTPHDPYGSKQARKIAKERAVMRMRERELARAQAAMAAHTATVGGGGGGGGGGGQASNFYQFARQMKTINYQLSSQKCLEEGWTLRAPSPLTGDDKDAEIFEPEAMLPPWADSEGKSRNRSLILKHYADGNKFIIMFPDGTGTIFYHSGRPAITVTATEYGLFSYIAHDDAEESARLLAVFEPNGHAVSYYSQSGNVRVFLDPVGGVELDQRGGRKRRWNWKDQQTHVHAPPIQPITFAVTPYVSVRIMGQDNITLTFNNKGRSCRFQVGSRLRLVAPENFPVPELDEDEMYRNEVKTKVEMLFNKVANLLKFPNCSRLDRLPTPKHLTSRQQRMGKLRESKEKDKEKGSQRIVTVN